MLPIKVAIESWRGMWVIRGELSRRAYWMLALVGLILPIAAWWWLSGSGLMDKVFMPTPLDVLMRALTWFKDEDLMRDV